MQMKGGVSLCLSVVMGGGTVWMVQTNNAVSSLDDQLPLTIVHPCIFMYIAKISHMRHIKRTTMIMK